MSKYAHEKERKMCRECRGPTTHVPEGNHWKCLACGDVHDPDA